MDWDRITDGIVVIAALECVLVVIVAGVQWLSETKFIGMIYERVAAKGKNEAKQKAEKEGKAG
jgi:hypothetical protein